MYNDGDVDERTGTESLLHPVRSEDDVTSAGAEAEGQGFDRSVLAALVDQHVDAMIAADKPGTVVDANHAITQLGWTPDDLVGTPAFDDVHPDDLERAAASAVAVSGH